MTETSSVTGPKGDTALQDQTIYVQGNKQKIESQDVAAITDLDRSIVYFIDKNERVYTEMPLRTIGSSQPDNTQGAPVRLDRTGKTYVVANHSCSEYRASAGNTVEHAHYADIGIKIIMPTSGIMPSFLGLPF